MTRPPRWAETLLRLFLPSRHAFSLIDGVALGAMLGTIFGVWNLVATQLDPLADDTPLALLVFYGPMFTAWGIAGFVAARRSGRFIDAIKVGTTVAFVTFVVFWVANLLRVNLFLDTIRDRADWQALIARYQTSGFESLRAFVNFDYLTGAPLKLFVPSVIGAITGSIGGLVAMVGRHHSREISQ